MILLDDRVLDVVGKQLTWDFNTPKYVLFDFCMQKL